jgi:aspartate kinase
VGKIGINGIIESAGLSMVSLTGVPSRLDAAAEVFVALAQQSINVECIVQSPGGDSRSDIAFCVARLDLKPALAVAEALRTRLGAVAVQHVPRVAMVGIFGPDFRETPGVAATMFHALTAAGVAILAISTSISTVSCVVAADHLGNAVAALEGAFELP